MADDLDFRNKFLISFMAFAAVICLGTLGFWVLGEGEFTLFDALYMTVITASTVGYGEVHDLASHTGARLFAMFIIVIGMGIIVYFASIVTAFFVEGDLKEIFRRKRMRKLIAGMQGHYIVCGVGTMGVHVVEELYRTCRKVVAIDQDQGRIEALEAEYPEVGLLMGDAAENMTLEEAGIERAAGVVVATTSDKDNLVITLSARQLNPNLRIVSRCSDVTHIEKMKRAGADTVVSSNFIGGMRLASEMVRPRVATFLDKMLRDREKVLRIEEAPVTETSGLLGKRIDEVRRSLLVLALDTPEGEYRFNPPGDYVLRAGETVIFMGSPEDRKEACQ